MLLAGTAILAAVCVVKLPGTTGKLQLVPAVECPTAARTIYPSRSPVQGSDHRIASVLNIPSPMRYGEFVWNDEGVPDGRVWIRVDRKAQIISVFRGEHEIGTAVALYGAPEKPTPAGRYPIQRKSREYRSRTYNAEMPFSLWLTDDGIAIHASDVRAGYATHGCIGIPEAFASKIFELARVGDEVIIV